MGMKPMARGELIRTRRDALNLSQQQVADAAHISQQSYAAIELDQVSNPKRSILKAISKMLDIPIETLIMNDQSVTGLSEGAVQVAKEYDKLSSEGKLAVMQALLRYRVAVAKDPVSARNG